VVTIKLTKKQTFDLGAIESSHLAKTSGT
jgi:hypothetical protein